MHSPSGVSHTLIKGIVWTGIGMVIIVVFHIGGAFALPVGQFSPLIGAFIGGTLAFASAFVSMRKREDAEPWIVHERLAWLLISLGVIAWGMGETCWRYYIAIGQTPFPSLADLGYFSFPLFVFVGLLLQPPSESGSRRVILLLDSLISMGSILALAWYLLLGSLAQAPGEANLAKFLGLYYPISDTALLSCVVFLLLRGQGRTYQATARRTGLLLVGLGLCFFVASDFIFNIQQNAGTYVEATWIDLGWPLGMMTIGIAAYLRRFLPATPADVIAQRLEDYNERNTFGPTQIIPYLLLGLLFLALTLNVLTYDPAQRAIRPVLVFATMAVVALVVGRQIYTIWENIRLTRQQAEALEDLERANQRVEEQAGQIAAHNVELEMGIGHLKSVQAQLANGNLRARANLTSGALLPLAGSLNLMAERLMRLGQTSAYSHRLLHALGDLCMAFERRSTGAPFILPASCKGFAEINRLLLSLHIDGIAHATEPLTPRPPMHYPATAPRPATVEFSRHRPDLTQTPQGAPRTAPRTVSGSRQFLSPDLLKGQEGR